MIKKKVIQGLIAFWCISLMSAAIPVAFAASNDSPNDTTDTSTDGSIEEFNVSQYLSVTDESGKTAETSALTDAATSPPLIHIILNAIVFITKIISSIAVLILVIAGLLMITSMHKEQQITRAKEMFVGALIGLIITFTAYILTTFVQSLFYT